MNIQNAAGAVTFSVLSGVLLNVLLPVGASNATVDAGPAGAGLKATHEQHCPSRHLWYRRDRPCHP
jgi:hypothetical protein